MHIDYDPLIQSYQHLKNNIRKQIKKFILTRHLFSFFYYLLGVVSMDLKNKILFC